MKFKFLLHRSPWGFATELFARCKFDCDDNRVGVIEGATIRTLDLNDPNLRDDAKPLMSFEENDGREALQALMDELWNFGVRPSDIGTPGHLAATTKHLEDMRAIAFVKLEVPKP